MREETERFPWVEVFRGLAILEVLFHHVSGRFLRVLDPEGAAWLALAALNRTLHFAVPAFLFMTSLVLGASLVRSFRLRRYLANRGLRLLWPYLLWSGVYLAWRYLEYPQWFDPARIPHQLLWGKAYFHLYFLAVALQLTLLLPLLRPLLLRKPPFWAWALGAVLLTAGVYLANRYLYRLPYPASFVLWYTPAIALGLYLAANLDRLEALLRRGLPWAGLGAASGLFLYLPLALAALRKEPVNTALYQAGHWLYTTGAAFLLLALAFHLSRGRLGRPLGFLGRYSLQIYLIHPLVIRVLEKIPDFPEALGTKPAFLVYLGLALLLPLFLAHALAKMRLSPWLFGR
ncbi:acyltransferase family protein [Thermus filiformis]|uniref:Acyltransferase n=1 Tax=Thermus filiformis TaxID=276 RepID=A0A0A2WTI8_THEFI|nr:acyltransferase [Thermus filiformis]KGQ21610.2 acyltransferase [Thermus filiformis]